MIYIRILNRGGGLNKAIALIKDNLLFLKWLFDRLSHIKIYSYVTITIYRDISNKQ